MYDFAIHRDTTATAAALWKVYTDVAGWPRWNKAISEAHLDGAFESGTKGQFTTIFGAINTFSFHLEHVVALQRFDLVWKLGPVMSTSLTHVIEQTATGVRFTHGFHAGGILAVAEFQTGWAAKAHVPGTMALVAELAEGRGA